MTDHIDRIPRPDLLLLAAFTVGILLLDGAQLPIIVAILVPLSEGLRRRIGAEEHGC